ncbi:MAG TPA: tetratricopeptide repeat protein [Bacteroidia bacterium]|nr:tetratricopeptide repeat protein [Bacteroidia bacterium]
MHLGIAFSIAKSYADSAVEFAKKAKDDVLFAGAYNSLGNVYLNNGNYAMGLEQFNIAESYARKSGKRQLLAKIINNKALCYERTGNYKKAFEMHFMALTIRQELKLPKEIALSYENMGAGYFYIGDVATSINYTKKAIAIVEKENDLKFLGELYGNLGVGYFNQYKDSLALHSYLKALDYAIKAKNKDGEASVCINLCSFFNELGQPLRAKEYVMKALHIENFYNNEKTIDLYSNLATTYKNLNKPDSALYFYQNALSKAKQLKFRRKIADVYNSLFMFYKEKGDYKNALEYKTLFHILNDSIAGEKNLKNIAEFETIYKTEKKNKEIELLNAENKIQKESSENRKKLLWVSLGGLALAIFAAAAFYMNFRRKKKDNIILQEKNIEIEKQKNLIAEKNKEIVDSINYAKRLQDAILPPQELIQKQLSQSFILYKPKDIVAGDFYWMYVSSELKVRSPEKGKVSELPATNYQLIAVADCTGHGVPGALVSVVCANALNTAVKEFGLHEPAKILDKVNELVEETFGKSASEVKDGMDISLIKIEAINDHPDNKLPKGKMVIPKGQSLSEYIESNKKYNIQWAGANNPLWYIKDGVWEEIKADKQPVGKFEYRKPFTNHSLQLKVNDSLFLISDGYADQFGGEHGKKINTKSLKDLLLKNSNASPQKQKETLEDEFVKWKGNSEQVDDVCIMGVRL